MPSIAVIAFLSVFLKHLVDAVIRGRQVWGEEVGGGGLLNQIKAAVNSRSSESSIY